MQSSFQSVAIYKTVNFFTRKQHILVVQPIRWRCVESAIHHEQDVHEE